MLLEPKVFAPNILPNDHYPKKQLRGARIGMNYGFFSDQTVEGRH